MTRQKKKDREKFYAAQWLLRRGIIARLEAHEHPDFVVRHGNETLGIEIVEYHGGTLGRGGAKVAKLKRPGKRFRNTPTSFASETPI
jgi:hypothetical protein